MLLFLFLFRAKSQFYSRISCRSPLNPPHQVCISHASHCPSLPSAWAPLPLMADLLLCESLFPIRNMFPHCLLSTGVKHSFAAGKKYIYNTCRFSHRCTLPLPPSLGLYSCLQYKHTACLAAGLENTSLLFWPKLFGQGVALLWSHLWYFCAHKTSQFQ